MDTPDPFDRSTPAPAGTGAATGIDSLRATGGAARLMKDASLLCGLLEGKLTLEEMQQVVRYARTILASRADDISERRMLSSIMANSNGKLNREEALLVYLTLTGIRGPLYGGGDGSSQERAVVIQTTSGAVGIRAEYEWIADQLGPRGAGWNAVRQQLHEAGDRAFDIINVRLSDGSERAFHFDVTSFFGNP